jgi:hypothetical protein
MIRFKNNVWSKKDDRAFARQFIEFLNGKMVNISHVRWGDAYKVYDLRKTIKFSKAQNLV